MKLVGNPLFFNHASTEVMKFSLLNHCFGNRTFLYTQCSTSNHFWVSKLFLHKRFNEFEIWNESWFHQSANWVLKSFQWIFPRRDFTAFNTRVEKNQLILIMQPTCASATDVCHVFHLGVFNLIFEDFFFVIQQFLFYFLSI